MWSTRKQTQEVKIIYLSAVLSILLGCSDEQSSEHISNTTDSIAVIDSIEEVVQEKPSQEIKDGSLPVDTALDQYLYNLGLSEIYNVATNHEPYQIEGYFNDDSFIDTAILVQHKENHKDGLLIKYGNSTEYLVLGAGEDVLGRGFDDLKWVGVFSRISKGEKVSSNIDEKTGEIRTTDVPDSEKHLLLTDGIYIHELESCGGGIIYWDKGEYYWVQQE